MFPNSVPYNEGWVPLPQPAANKIPPSELLLSPGPLLCPCPGALSKGAVFALRWLPVPCVLSQGEAALRATDFPPKLEALQHPGQYCVKSEHSHGRKSPVSQSLHSHVSFSKAASMDLYFYFFLVLIWLLGALILQESLLSPFPEITNWLSQSTEHHAGCVWGFFLIEGHQV